LRHSEREWGGIERASGLGRGRSSNTAAEVAWRERS